VLNGTAFFNLSNSGNDSAYQLTIVPHIPTARTAYAAYNLGVLPPRSVGRFNMTLASAAGRGTYAGRFDVTYQQGTDYFTAVFPCLFSFRNATSSSVYLTPNVTDEENGTVLVRVSILNGGASEVDANVSLILPPSISAVSGGNTTLDLSPDIKTNVSFYVSTPSSQASYAAAVVASYESGGLGYASLSTFIISSGKSQPVNFGTATLWAALVVIVVLLVLLIRSYLRKRGKRPAAA
jgi:hypothetical protein